MLGSLLITLREGLEVTLIIGIILAYLARTDNRQGFKPVWFGVSLAVAVSLIVGFFLFLLTDEVSERVAGLLGGAAMFLAVCVLTWMIFWMRKQARNIRAHLEAQVQSALTAGSSLALAGLAFTVVVREGMETVLFLFAASRMTESLLLFTLGGLLGLAIATAIGYIIYQGAARLNLRVFFNVTSVMLMVFAAGILAHGIHEFHEVGIIPPLVEHVWDITSILSEESVVGAFLHIIIGYNDNPSLVQVVAYFGYLVSALWSYFRPTTAKGEVKAAA